MTPQDRLKFYAGILVVIFFGYHAILGITQNYTYLAYWIAAVIEGYIGLVFVSYATVGITQNFTYLAYWIEAIIEHYFRFLEEEKVEKRHPPGDLHRWSFNELIIIVFAIGTPVTLSYAIDSLESIRGTWIFFIIASTSLGLYRLSRKNGHDGYMSL